MGDISIFVHSELREDLEEILYATTLDTCSEIEDDGLLFSDVIWRCINGDISYEDAQRWCKKNRIPKKRLDDGLLAGLLNSSRTTKKSLTLQDILFKIVDFLNGIIGWILEGFDD